MSGSQIARTGIDTYADSSKPTANYASSKTLLAQGSGLTRQVFLWIKSPAPPGATIASAMLRVYATAAWSGSTTLTATRVSQAWVESHLTYNARPATTGATAAKTLTGTAAGAEWAIDVTALVQAWANGAANYGLRITSSTAVARSIYGFAAGTLTPVLDVAWSDAPGAPTTLSPDGTRAVSITKPVLRFDFHDVSGDTTLAAVQVQIKHGSNDFTAPTFDSGTVAASEPQLDLSATAYAGTTAGTTAYWRVRVQDGSGLWSAWSDAAVYTKVNRAATFTLDNPASGGAPFVSEATPPIIWTFTDGTRRQAAWRVQIIDVTDDPSKVTYDSGKRTSTTDNSFTLPQNVLTDTGDTYKVILNVWDDVSRESTPGDPAAYEIQRSFAYAEDPTPAVVTALAAAVYAQDRPWVRLTWSRATAPDSFTVVRGTTIVASGLDPADISTGSTAYAWLDKDAWPHATHTWKVQSVVNGKSSPGPTVSLAYEVQAVWLIDPTTDYLCPILVTDQADFSMPDVAGVYEPVNSNHVVRIVQAQRGLEGTISGRIQTYAGGSAGAWVSNLRYFKARPSQEFVLILGAQSIHCVVGNVQITPLAGGTGPDDRAVSISFWSTRGWISP